MKKTIKYLKNNIIKLDGVTYQGYCVGALPNSFGFKARFNGFNEDGDEIFKKGKDNWFNHKGLTYIEKTILPW